MQITRPDNVKISFSTSGSGPLALVFVHGAFIDKEYWEGQVNHFSSKYQVVTIDMAGHGTSGNNRDDWSMETFGKDVVAVINEFALQKIILIGHSMGGDIVLEVAGAIPEKVIGLVGVDNFKNAGTALSPEIQEQIEQALLMMETDFAAVSESFARQMLITPSTSHPISERVTGDYRNFTPRVGIAMLRSGFLYYSREREWLQNLKMKLYLINVDYFPTNETLLKQYANAGYEVRKVEGSCHYPMIENPEDFNRILGEIVSEIEAGL